MYRRRPNVDALDALDALDGGPKMGVGRVAYKHIVTVHGQDYEVETFQEFKTVWSAAGKYEGGFIATADRSMPTLPNYHDPPSFA